MAAARATCERASSRSPSGRTRRIPGCICPSWLRQAAAGRLQGRAEREKLREALGPPAHKQLTCKHPDAVCVCVCGCVAPSGDA